MVPSMATARPQQEEPAGRLCPLKPSDLPPPGVSSSLLLWPIVLGCLGVTDPLGLRVLAVRQGRGDTTWPGHRAMGGGGAGPPAREGRGEGLHFESK